MTTLSLRPTRATTEQAAPTAIPTPPTARRKRLVPRRSPRWAPIAGPVLILGLWSISSTYELIDTRMLPAPWTIAATFLDLWTTGTLVGDIATSLQRAAIGFGLGLAFALVLSLLAGLTRVGDTLIDGTVQLKRAIPTLGLIPLLILWLGIGESFKIVIIALSVFVPIYINLVAALQGIDHRYVELAQVLRLNRTQFIRQVVFPGALPGLFIGLRLAVNISWLSLVVLEQINATSGLGYMMFQAQNYGQMDVIVVGLVIYGVFGFFTDTIIRTIERKALSWRRGLH
ncbi:ABC transporter permease [Rhodococcus sp. PAMC28707]|uniref:ABC transporter permease n=1 Tax=unclassified Rhodococcus (in: high G+C Gram-positive bacteria) TaxID=192944 RepID=UPI00109DC2ED|nr:MULTISPECIES: ABC transporter permease [unclassified Rhodococcus (in: high G+C Gram-positive bacteria)]QCB50074.1 ABC transporter permease [Rhodococcus sp. PAMC28705]QCB58231.1 ABC transporter permease [Rhodococcus sp. PAMC28707]